VVSPLLSLFLFFLWVRFFFSHDSCLSWRKDFVEYNYFFMMLSRTCSKERWCSFSFLFTDSHVAKLEQYQGLWCKCVPSFHCSSCQQGLELYAVVSFLRMANCFVVLITAKMYMMMMHQLLSLCYYEEDKVYHNSCRPSLLHFLCHVLCWKYYIALGYACMWIDDQGVERTKVLPGCGYNCRMMIKFTAQWLWVPFSTRKRASYAKPDGNWEVSHLQKWPWMSWLYIVRTLHYSQCVSDFELMKFGQWQKVLELFQLMQH
jgi:hypothetical protein